ncbi:AI-2E family transporter [Humibacter albus]|jgi:predicted PurR-regulated permease PerM|uniref:AI-2E family transporter n=1 Tax=Humibacter albus TaxID=427754 RepID=UPI0003B45526|nr:AI-2E family transporter [Humibacter albus]
MKIQNAFRVGLIGTLGVGLGILILSAIVSLSTVVTYIGAALFLALGLEPIIAFLERRKLPRWSSIVIVLVVILSLLGLLLWAIIPIIVKQASSLVEKITEFVQNGTYEDWYVGLQKQFPGIDFDKTLQDVWGSVQHSAGDIGAGLLSVGIGIVSGFFGVLIVLILTIYFTASLPNMKRTAYELVPASKRARFADIAEQITDSVGKYVMGQVALALCNGILSAIFLTIIGAPFPLLLAVIAFLFSLIPLVGTLTGSVVIVLLTLVLLPSSPITALIAAIWYVIYMQVEAYVLSPRIMNRAVSVPGALVVIAALAGGSLLGLLGALIAIPVAASMLLIIKQVVVPRQNEL